VEQWWWWNSPESDKLKDTEESFLSTNCSTTYFKSTRLVLRWATAGRDTILICDVAVKNRFNFSILLAI